MGFSQTCHQLSQFLKERQSNGDFKFIDTTKLDLNGGKEMCGASTMNLFPMNNIENKEENSFKSWDFFPLMSSPSDVSTPQNRELTTNNGEPTRASMTIFYGGKVLVFDDLPEAKALEIMSFASQGIMSNSVAHTRTQSQIQIQTQTQTQTQSQIQTQTQNQMSNNHTFDEALPIEGGVDLQEQLNLSDLPIARRVSLHRFMAKRKDRIAGNAPYPLHKSSRGNYMKDSLVKNIDDQLAEKRHELNLFK